MNRPPAEVEERLRRLAGEARNLFTGLAEILNDLPPTPLEQSAEDLAEEGEPGDLRSTVLCILNDLVRPTVHNLLLAAGSDPDEVAQQAPEVPGVRAAPAGGAEPALCSTVLPGGQAVVTIAMEHVVPIPPEIATLLDLMMFDMLAVEVRPDGVLFEPLRTLLRGIFLLPGEGQISAVQAIVRGRFTLLVSEGLLLFPAYAPPLRSGDRVKLQIEQGEHGLRLRVSPTGPPPAASPAPDAGE